MYTIPSAIFFEAFLSFIGIGITAPETSLGVLLNEGQKNFQFLPYQMWYPAIVLCVLMIAFNLLGDGLRDVLAANTYSCVFKDSVSARIIRAMVVHEEIAIAKIIEVIPGFNTTSIKTRYKYWD